jgi:hypothetical protein
LGLPCHHLQNPRWGTSGPLEENPRAQPAWALALGTAAVWYLEPALAEMAELVGGVALSNNKSLARGAITEMRRKAAGLRGQLAPLPASALAKVVRRSEAAGGAVLNKGARMRELQASWDDFLACLRTSAKAQDPPV